MPRFIDSLVGGRQITIPEQTDKFTDATNTMVDGTPLLTADMLTSGSPTYCHCFDRATGASGYTFVAGQARSIVVWIQNFDLAGATQDMMGVSPLASPGTWHWSIERQSGSGRRFMQIRNLAAGETQVAVGRDGTDDNGVPEMIAVTWSGVDAVAGNLKGYGNGALRASVTHSAAPAPTDPQFWFGRAANQALSTVTPTTSLVGSIEMSKLAVWNRELSGPEISGLYAAMVP